MGLPVVCQGWFMRVLGAAKAEIGWIVWIYRGSVKDIREGGEGREGRRREGEGDLTGEGDLSWVLCGGGFIKSISLLTYLFKRVRVCVCVCDKL
jgi:hypothetical protein